MNLIDIILNKFTAWLRPEFYYKLLNDAELIALPARVELNFSTILSHKVYSLIVVK